MNHVALIGRLTADPELKRTTNGNSACNFTLAVNRYKKTEGQPDADFIRCKAFGKTAENLCRYQHKGSLIAVSGSIQTGSYEKDGQRHYTTDILVGSVEFLEKKENGAQTGFTGANSGYQPQQPAYSQPYQPNSGYQTPPQAGYQPYGDGLYGGKFGISAATASVQPALSAKFRLSDAAAGRISALWTGTTSRPAPGTAVRIQLQQVAYSQPYQPNSGYQTPPQAGYQPYGQAPQAAQPQAPQYEYNYNKYNDHGQLNPAPQPQDALGISSDDLPF